MFEKPYKVLNKQNTFNIREVGVTHPDLSSFIRLADNGDVYVMADETTGIIISANQRSIILVGDTVKFFTKEDEGLRWNKLAFNAKATKYSEPTFIFPKQTTTSIYDGIDDFIGDL
jgi:hypothetical protein